MPVQAENAGLFISPGHGTHPDRVIETQELIHVRKGSLAMWEERTRLQIDTGQILLLSPGRRHRGAEAYPPDLEFFWIHFRILSRVGGHGLRLPQQTALHEHDRFSELSHRFLDMQESNTTTQLEKDLTLLLMLNELSRKEGQSAAPDPVMRAETYIAQHFHRSISAGDIAAAMQLNADYLGRLFRKAHGWSLTEAIHRRQIREARSLLRTTTLNMDQVAFACGFHDARYFRRIFQRYQGVSPRAYRQFHTRLHINTH